MIYGSFTIYWMESILYSLYLFSLYLIQRPKMRLIFLHGSIQYISRLQSYSAYCFNIISCSLWCVSIGAYEMHNASMAAVVIYYTITTKRRNTYYCHKLAGQGDLFNGNGENYFFYQATTCWTTVLLRFICENDEHHKGKDHAQRDREKYSKISMDFFKRFNMCCAYVWYLVTGFCCYYFPRCFVRYSFHASQTIDFDL